MFIILLTFSENKSQASRFMAGHKAWIEQGLTDGVFLMVGSLQPNKGGAVLAHNSTLQALQSRVNSDPFVVENVVNAEILEISPHRGDERLNFLLN
ncbi:YciI family protein [Thalassomonas sp. RHCl1]|uniref:YciI family protein n=1 Tax=Thalassomonas sp. RHCl1 TaxID=2995320 RepID=UPI00248C387B|nr:YciI family protein [Thalassomonas sp. RHCl1]